MAKRDANETPSIQSLGRGLSILEAVAESSEPVPLKQLTDLLGIDRSSVCLLYTSPSPRDRTRSRMPSSA